MTKKTNKKVDNTPIPEHVEVEVAAPKLTKAEKTASRIEAAQNKVNKEYAKALEKLSTTSARIRYLDSVGFTKSEIRDVLGIIYQHVYNVLNTPLMEDIKKERAEACAI